MAQKATGADIYIRTERFRPRTKELGLDENSYIYLESGIQFTTDVLNHGGLVLHASAVEVGGRAYLFSAPCGTGKSTHSRMWKAAFGDSVSLFNDDKPVLRFMDGAWYAYGSPWCGKDGININKKVKLAGICFLKQAQENKIRRLSTQESVHRMIWQTAHNYANVRRMDMRLSLIESVVKKIPIFELENRPEPEAARMSYEAMRCAAEESGI